jgi:hypothetical protein
MQGIVWTCIGQIDEAHPFCPFATRYAAKAAEHAKLEGHSVIDELVPGDWPLSKLQLECLENEIRCIS